VNLTVLSADLFVDGVTHGLKLLVLLVGLQVLEPVLVLLGLVSHKLNAVGLVESIQR